MKRILFVDDDAHVLNGLKAGLYLRRKDWDMSFANGGASALELLKDRYFDVLVADIRMPGVDGTELLSRARGEWPQTIRIVLSGYSDEVQSQRLVSLAHRYLSKPCEPKRLEESIDRCLAVQALIDSDALRAQLGAIGDLAPMPSTFAALQRALADPSVDASKVAQVIQSDPAVSAKVLQVCNSAFFRLPRRVSNIQQAVSYLGLSIVRSVTIAAEVFKPDARLPLSLDLPQLQRHSLSIATIARSVGASSGWGDDAFLAGLLHDVGLLALGKLYPMEVEYSLRAVAQGMSLVAAERAYLGVDHATAGAYLLGLWGLPYEIVDTVARHELRDVPDLIDFNARQAVAIAHELLRELRPSDMPHYETETPKVDDEYLRTIGCPHSLASLMGGARALLTAEGPI